MTARTQHEESNAARVTTETAPAKEYAQLNDYFRGFPDVMMGGWAEPGGSPRETVPEATTTRTPPARRSATIRGVLGRVWR